MKGIGKMIYRMDKVLKPGLMGQGMKDIIKMEKSMEEEPTPGVMVQDM